jgi:glycopeptide antibiotics resistance protein
MAIVAYGSLFPLDWDFATPNAFGWFEHAGRLDIVKNIVLFMPLGFLVAVMAAHAPTARAAFVLRWALGACAFAAALQVAQVYLPRDPEAADILTNMIGFALGYFGGPLLRALHLQVHPSGRIRGSEPFLLVLTGIWLCAVMFPFLPVWRSDMLREQWVPLSLLVEIETPRQFALHSGVTYIGMYAVYHLLQPLPRVGRHAGLAMGFAFLAAVEAKLFGFSQTPTWGMLTGMLAGLMAWIVAHRLLSVAQARLALGVVALALYVVYAVLPLNFRAPVFFQWWPFGSLLGGNLSVALRGYCIEALALGTLMWVMTRSSLRISTAALAVGSLGFACEWLQRYLQYRTPEIGAVVMVAVLAFLLASCARVAAPAGQALPLPAFR